MKTWKRKSKEPTLEDQYKQEIKQLDEYQVQTLDHVRDVFQIWSMVCANESMLGVDRIDFIETQEKYIKSELLDTWGACRLEIDRSTQVMIVKSNDGRAMNLKTGELL